MQFAFPLMPKVTNVISTTNEKIWGRSFAFRCLPLSEKAPKIAVVGLANIVHPEIFKISASEGPEMVKIGNIFMEIVGMDYHHKDISLPLPPQPPPPHREISFGVFLPLLPIAPKQMSLSEAVNCLRYRIRITDLFCTILWCLNFSGRGFQSYKKNQFYFYRREF